MFWPRLPFALALLSSCLVPAMAVLGCGGDTGPAPSSDAPGVSQSKRYIQDQSRLSQENTLVFATLGDLETLDPGKMSGVVEGRVAMNAFEGLFMPDNGDGPPVYGVAESHTVSDDGMTWTIVLRGDAVWSNGEAVTAHDFAFSWRRMLTPSFAANYADFLDDIVGAKEYREGTLTDWEQVGVKAVDDRTLRIQLKSPVGFFDEKLSFYAFFPVHRASLVESWNDDGTWTEVDGYWLDPQHIVSNGPYLIREVKSGQHVILERNPNWRDADSVRIERVRIRIFGENMSVINSFRQGELDVVFSGIPVREIPALRGHEEYITHPLLGTYYYRFNTTANEGLADKRVRKALSLTINRTDLARRTLRGQHEPALQGFVPPMEGYRPNVSLTFNPERARELLAEAGYPDEQGNMPTFSLLYNTDDNHRLIAETLQDQWKTHLGINVELYNQEWSVYLNMVDRMDYEVARAGWIGDYYDPETFLKLFIKGSGNNNTGWSNDEYDRLLDQATRTVNREERYRLYAQAEEILIEELPIIPIYYYGNQFLVSTRVQGFKPHIREVYQFRYWSLRTQPRN